MERVKVNNLAVDKVLAIIKKHEYPLFFIHGAGGSTGYLSNYMNFFALAGWDCYAVNLRGHAPSDPEPEFAGVTIGDYVEDVKKVINHFNIQNSALIGHSMGGLVAQKTTSLMPSIKALITITSAPPKGVKIELKKNFTLGLMIVRSIWGNITKKSLKPSYIIARRTVLNNLEEKDKRAVFDMLVPESLAVSKEVAGGVEVDLTMITCPRLVIACEKDALALPGMQRQLADLLKADYISYPQFAHIPMLEPGWEKGAEDIKSWLEQKVG